MAVVDKIAALIKAIVYPRERFELWAAMQFLQSKIIPFLNESKKKPFDGSDDDYIRHGVLLRVLKRSEWLPRAVHGNYLSRKII